MYWNTKLIKYTFIVFLFIGIVSLNWKNVYSQKLEQTSVKFVPIDTILVNPNQIGITEYDSKIISIELNKHIYFTKISSKLISSGLIKELKKIELKKRIRYIKEIDDLLIIWNEFGYTVLNPTTLKSKFIKNDIYNTSDNIEVFSDQMVPNRVWHRKKLYTNSSFINRENVKENPNLLIFNMKNNKLYLENAIGKLDSTNYDRLYASYQWLTGIQLDTTREIIYGNYWSGSKISKYNLKGELLSTFGQNGKLATFDSIVNIEFDSSAFFTKREFDYYNRLLVKYENLVLNIKDNLLFRIYTNGQKIEIEPDSLKSKGNQKPGSCGLDLYYLNLIENSTPPEKGMQIYNLNNDPPNLICDILYPSNLPDFYNMYFDKNGLLVFRVNNHITGSVTFYRYKVVF